MSKWKLLSIKMATEEVFHSLSEKYGDDFNWYIIPLTNKTYVEELKKEIGTMHLYFSLDLFANNAVGFPKCREIVYYRIFVTLLLCLGNGVKEVGDIVLNDYGDIMEYVKDAAQI